MDKCNSSIGVAGLLNVLTNKENKIIFSLFTPIRFGSNADVIMDAVKRINFTLLNKYKDFGGEKVDNHIIYSFCKFGDIDEIGLDLDLADIYLLNEGELSVWLDKYELPENFPTLKITSAMSEA